MDRGAFSNTALCGKSCPTRQFQAVHVEERRGCSLSCSSASVRLGWLARSRRRGSRWKQGFSVPLYLARTWREGRTGGSLTDVGLPGETFATARKARERQGKANMSCPYGIWKRSDLRTSLGCSTLTCNDVLSTAPAAYHPSATTQTLTAS